MKTKSLLAVLASLILISWPAHSAEYMAYPIGSVGISDNYSDDDDVVIRTDVVYPNGCYFSHEHFDYRMPGTQIIKLIKEVKVLPGVCTMALKYDQTFFDLSEYDEGVYKLVDGFENEAIARLVVDDEGQHIITDLQ